MRILFSSALMFLLLGAGCVNNNPVPEPISIDHGNAAEKVDLIRVDVPQSGSSVKSPLKISGSARGSWFFEGSFPVKLLLNSQVIATGIATAQGEWMTEDFVPFTATLSWKIESSENLGAADIFGTLVLQKDNPSGLPENDDELRVPVSLIYRINETGGY